MDLFNLPETKSQRLKWMERHHLTVQKNRDAVTPAKEYECRHGMQAIGYGPTEHDAVVAAAKSLNIRMWNEQ